MDLQKLIEEVLHVIQNHVPQKTDVFLFGSWAKGTALPTSDLDIALLGPLPIPPQTMAQIREELENIQTLRGIDLVDLNAVDASFKNAILKDAKKLSIQ